MARKKNEFDKEEVEEIINLKFKQVERVPKKITYNNVYTFNKEIANNPKYKRKNGKLFKTYSFDFWCNCYNGEPNIGRYLIDKFKDSHSLETVMGEFQPSIKGIIAKVNRYHDNPYKLSKFLADVFEKDKQQIEKLKGENLKLKEQVDTLKNDVSSMQQGLYNIFYNSTSTKNSLSNMLSLDKSDDGFAKELVVGTFGSEEHILDLLRKTESNKEKAEKVVDIKAQQAKKREKINKYNL